MPRKNHTHIYPDSLVTYEALEVGLKDWVDAVPAGKGAVSSKDIDMVLNALETNYGSKSKEAVGNPIAIDPSYLKDGGLTRRDFAILIDSLINPFENQSIDIFGNFSSIP